MGCDSEADSDAVECDSEAVGCDSDTTGVLEDSVGGKGKEAAQTLS